MAILDSNDLESPGNSLLLGRVKGGGGIDDPVGASDEVSLAPSVSSLGSFDEQSTPPPLALQQAREADKTDRPLPTVLLLPPALDHTAKTRQALRRRSCRSVPLALPSASTGAGIEEGLASSVPLSDSASAASVQEAGRTEREHPSARLGIAFGGASKRRRSRRLTTTSSNSSVGVSLAGSHLAAAADQDGPEKSVVSTEFGAAGAPASSATTSVATAALLKRKINWWRSLPKPPPKVPHRSPALPMLTGEDGSSRGAASSAAPSYSRGRSDYGDGGTAVRDGPTVSMTPSLPGAISREPQHQLPAARGGRTDDERTRAGSIASSLTSLGGSMGPVPVGAVAKTDSSVASFASTSQASGSGALLAGRSAAGSATTASLAATTGPTAGLSGAGAGVGVASASAGSGGTRERLDSGEHKKSKKKRRGRGGNGSAVERVHKINLGSKSHQKVR